MNFHQSVNVIKKFLELQLKVLIKFSLYLDIQCGYPADIANGDYVLVNDSVGYLSRVIYSCDQGFEMIGRAQLACDIDERWNGPPPRCERK